VAQSNHIAWEWALGPVNLMSGPAQMIPCYGAENPGWRDDFSQYSDAQREHLRLATLDSLEANIPKALVDVNLVTE
jgi:hypothetical protein